MKEGWLRRGKNQTTSINGTGRRGFGAAGPGNASQYPKWGGACKRGAWRQLEGTTAFIFLTLSRGGLGGREERAPPHPQQS